MSRPPLRVSSRYVRRAVQSRHASLNLSKLPKLPEGTPPLISRRSTPGNYEFDATWNQRRKTVDDDFSQAVRLEVSAEKKLELKSGKKLYQKKMLAVEEQEQPPILSKNPRKERSDLSLRMITPKATVHRFAVVRTRVRRRIVGAFDLIVRRGVYPFPESKPRQPNKHGKPKVEDHGTNPEGPRILLHDPTLADIQTWVLPNWSYIVFPKAEVFKMPLPDLVDQVRLGLRQVNQKARAWEARYVSPETGEFIPLLSKDLSKRNLSLEPKFRKPEEFTQQAPGNR